jgi:hypothetical protein
LQLIITHFETKEDVITYLLVNMEGTASAWVLPHLANIGTIRQQSEWLMILIEHSSELSSIPMNSKQQNGRSLC